MLAGDELVDRLVGDVGGEEEELDGDELLRAVSAACECSREPVKRQTMTRLAKPSMKESSPKETSAIEPAAMPAVSAMTPSAPIQASESQESRRALRAASCHSRLRAVEVG